MTEIPAAQRPIRIVATAASAARTMLLRIDDTGRLEQRWLPASDDDGGWTPWMIAPIDAPVADVAVISGWSRQIEIFVLDSDGGVWNRWWWEDRDWEPRDGFSYRGRPFGGPAAGIAALSAGDGHFNVFVAALDGRIATLPHVDTFEVKWRSCPHGRGLNDGWWPAFDYTEDDVVYRSR